MPFSAPVPRKAIHHRRVDCQGFEREDGLWDIEGWLTDTKTYAFTNQDRGTIEPGEALHGMGLRLTIDMDLHIHDAEAVIDFSPFTVCPSVAGNYKRLIGLTIGRGFRDQAKERLGGPEGCTHLVELLGPIATTAFQALFKARSDRREASGKGANDARGLLNTCHALRSDGPIVKRDMPKYYTGAEDAAQ
ncbi:MAG: DUF2889 domain-containing protein [Rhodospirillum sp.]|nr:DUF2889 domain-containing protein [Rhodospirillum sp.]MCF8488885.1 DUF2889 domain-containing protein [Rhodospirillum sp.]MCF8500053.1 DUF2889 domain-containing protein [Rhodospirillum sp.]